MDTHSTRVGLDTTRATPALRAAVEHGAGTLTITGPRSGQRLVRFRDMGREAALAAFEGLAPGRVRIETRSDLDMLRRATGIATWLVVEGDLAARAPEPDDGTRAAA